MKSKQTRTSALFIGLACALLLTLNVGGAGAQGEGYAISWRTTDSGGVTAWTGGDYVLSATAGQPDAASVGAGEYALIGGFWPVATGPVADHELYLPLVLRDL